MINKINNLPQNEFIIIFSNIFEKTKWIAERLYDQKPFNSFEDLCSKMLEIFKTTSEKNQLKIIRAHPDLADKISIYLLSSNYLFEHNKAWLDKCWEKEFKEAIAQVCRIADLRLKELNIK